MDHKLVLGAALGLVLVGLAPGAGAVSLTLDDCDAFGCRGSRLSLVVVEGPGFFDVTYTIDTDGYLGDRAGLNQVGFKAVRGWTSASLLAQPVGSSAPWSDPVEAPISSNSLCGHTNGNTDKICSHGFVDITGGGSHTWSLRLTGGVLLGTADWHLGAQYADAHTEARGRIISAEAAPVPEAHAMLLFWIGAGLVGAAVRRPAHR